MGLLVEGNWQDKWYDTDSTEGKFVRSNAQYRNWVTTDGSAGPTGDSGFKAEAGRYHLYVSLACPWAHRTLIFRKLKGLEKFIDISVVNPLMAEHGWTFKDAPGVIADPVRNAEFLHQIYTADKADYTGRVTVPVLWDKQQQRIVSNESADIIRMFNSAFDRLGAEPGDYYPEKLRNEIEQVNDRVYHTVNNGVYKAGFATKQDAYNEAVTELFQSLEWLETRLGRSRYLTGDMITEADWRLFTTLIRFDPVYHGHFKCNIKRIADYPNLWGFTRELYQWAEVKETVNFEHIKGHYYRSHTMINPTGIVPQGPELEPLEQPHGRG
ncbi:glutathione S-transferase family protein [Gilvimarinus sp. DA14]|uniref:glutathione S-transferase family protein n=1 Tax=Gilvimarinus sp. DA14 TaxID=2956798 RepID=UPI0020B70ADE|nr:glutathione S-transferase family protein [Gilvimarinus sp. DA14]UTF59515.1 glutathione S-transferase family protein [Gilvimarinus sp. DA14]